MKFHGTVEHTWEQKIGQRCVFPDFPAAPVTDGTQVPPTHKTLVTLPGMEVQQDSKGKEGELLHLGSSEPRADGPKRSHLPLHSPNAERRQWISGKHE